MLLAVSGYVEVVGIGIVGGIGVVWGDGVVGGGAGRNSVVRDSRTGSFDQWGTDNTGGNKGLTDFEIKKYLGAGTGRVGMGGDLERNHVDHIV